MSNGYNGDITLLCAGGGGGAQDRWSNTSFSHKDYPEIHTTLEQYFYVIAEIDVEKKTYEFKVFGLGNEDRKVINDLIDSWTRNIPLDQPNQPQCDSTQVLTGQVQLHAHDFEGTGNTSLFTSHIQVVNKNEQTMVVDQIRDIRNIYGAGSDFVAIDKNQGIDLTSLSVTTSTLGKLENYEWRIRYKDDNTKWSDWSAYVAVASTPDTTPTAVGNLDQIEIKYYYDVQSKCLIVDLSELPSTCLMSIYNSMGTLLYNEAIANLRGLTKEYLINSSGVHLLVWRTAAGAKTWKFMAY